MMTNRLAVATDRCDIAGVEVIVIQETEDGSANELS